MLAVFVEVPLVLEADWWRKADGAAVLSFGAIVRKVGGAG